MACDIHSSNYVDKFLPFHAYYERHEVGSYIYTHGPPSCVLLMDVPIERKLKLASLFFPLTIFRETPYK